MSRARAVWQRVPALVVDIVLVAVAAVDVLVVDMWEHTRPEVTLAAVGCAALALRRRFPLGVFLLTLPIALMQDVAVAVLAALFTLAERSRNRRLLAVCVVLAAVASSTPWPLAEADRTMTLVFFVYGLATSVAPVLFGQLLQARRDLARRLAEVEEAREHERTLHAQAVLARERAQLAREMHDVVSHQVSLIAVRAGALQVAAKDADAKEAARTIRSLSVTTLDELRTMVTLLRASGGKSTELTPQPTLADLRKLVESSGTHTELTGELPPTVGTPAQRALYRTVQEALTNVRKHAGPTATVRLRVAVGRDVEVEVRDDGRGAAAGSDGRGLGVVGMRERATAHGGTLEAGPVTGGGFAVSARLPL
jgi:signal transduction histidine kinase